MVRLEDIIHVYFLMRRNKRRSEDSVSFEINLERNIMNLYNSIRDLTLRADANYTFITSYPRPREVFAAEMSVRLCHAYIDYRLKPIIEKIYTDRTFNNRIGMGGEAAINKLIEDIYDVSRGFTHEAWVIKWDLAGYFPNADIDVAFRNTKNIIEEYYEGDDKDDLIWMSMICLYAHPQNHCYRKSNIEKWDNIEYGKSLFNKDARHGGVIGFLIWQANMTLYLNHVDHFAVDECRLYYVRFVDDTAVVTDNKEAMLALIPKFREMYRDVGIEMHKKKFYCQRVEKGVEFLGSHIKRDRVYLNNRTIKRFESRIDAFNTLSDGLKFKNISSFISSMNSYLGLMKGRNEYNNIKRCIKRIDKSWLRYIHFNKDRIIIEANECYTNRELLIKKYNIKIKNHGKKQRRITKRAVEGDTRR